ISIAAHCILISYSSPYQRYLPSILFFFFFMIRRPPRSTLFPLHDALPIFAMLGKRNCRVGSCSGAAITTLDRQALCLNHFLLRRSEEHTSELQSRSDLVCRLLLEKKK